MNYDIPEDHIVMLEHLEERIRCYEDIKRDRENKIIKDHCPVQRGDLIRITKHYPNGYDKIAQGQVRYVGMKKRLVDSANINEYVFYIDLSPWKKDMTSKMARRNSEKHTLLKEHMTIEILESHEEN